MSLLLDLSHTSHYPGHSGIQRVCRAAYPSFCAQKDVTPLCYDHHVRVWRMLLYAALAPILFEIDFRRMAVRNNAVKESQVLQICRITFDGYLR